MVERMFDKGQPQPQPKSLAEIVREETDNGRDIVRFLVDALEGKMVDAKPCHRLGAAEQLLDFGDQWDLAEFILERTDDSRLIVCFLLDVMQLKIDGVAPRDQGRARQLLNRIFNGETWIPLPVPPGE